MYRTMRFRHVAFISIALFFGQGLALAQIPEGSTLDKNPLVGAWLITETDITNSDGTTELNRDPATGVYIFTEGHFSAMLVPGSSREPVYLREHTDEELLAAYANFSADAGPYELTETTMKTTNLIAKIPDFMTSSMHYEWWLDGEALVLKFSDGWAPPGGQIIYRLRRLE